VPGIIKIISNLPELDHIYSYEYNLKRNNNIQNSAVVVFFLTVDYIKSENLKADIEYARNLKKLTLFVLIDINVNIEDIFNDYNDFINML
jgi:hypothetical protein